MAELSFTNIKPIMPTSGIQMSNPPDMLGEVPDPAGPQEDSGGFDIGNIAEGFTEGLSPQDDLNQKFMDRNKNIMNQIQGANKASDVVSNIALKSGNPFAMLAGASDYFDASGTANAQILTTRGTLEPIRVIRLGMRVRWKPTLANTATAVTIAVDALPVKSLKNEAGVADIAIGHLSPSRYAEAVYDGTKIPPWKTKIKKIKYRTRSKKQYRTMRMVVRKLIPMSLSLHLMSKKRVSFSKTRASTSISLIFRDSRKHWMGPCASPKNWPVKING